MLNWHDKNEQKLPTELIDSRLRFAESVLQWTEEVEEDVWHDSLRIGLGTFAAGGGFKRSAIPFDTVVPPGFFNLSEPEWEELPSNTIRGRFLLWSLLELDLKKQ